MNSSTTSKEDWSELSNIPQDTINTIFCESKRRFEQENHFLPEQDKEDIFGKFWLNPRNNLLKALKHKNNGSALQIDIPHTINTISLFLHSHAKNTVWEFYNKKKAHSNMDMLSECNTPKKSDPIEVEEVWEILEKAGAKSGYSTMIRCLRKMQWYPGLKINRKELFRICDKTGECVARDRCLFQPKRNGVCKIRIGKIMAKIVMKAFPEEQSDKERKSKIAQSKRKDV